MLLGAGYGKEKIKGYHSHKEDLYRLSATYDIKYDHFKVAPMIAFDYADGNPSAVVGVNFAVTF